MSENMLNKTPVVANITNVPEINNTDTVPTPIVVKTTEINPNFEVECLNLGKQLYD
jgi:hypothetical protein